MPISTDPHSLTEEQAVQLRNDLALVEDRLDDIAVLMRVCFGEASQAVEARRGTVAEVQAL